MIKQLMSMEQFVEWKLAGKSKYSKKNWPRATLSTNIPTWSDLGLNPCKVEIMKLLIV
jgi:hypothetical protein